MSEQLPEHRRVDVYSNWSGRTTLHHFLNLRRLQGYEDYMVRIHEGMDVYLVKIYG